MLQGEISGQAGKEVQRKLMEMSQLAFMRRVVDLQVETGWEGGRVQKRPCDQLVQL